MSELTKLTEKLWTSYFVGKGDNILSLMDRFYDDTVIIGTGKQEFYRNLQEFQKGMSSEIQERKDISFQIRNLSCEEMKITEDVFLVYGSITIWWQNDAKTVVIDMTSRFSVIYRREDEAWKIVHVHQSTPNPEQMEDESYPKTLVDQVESAHEIIESLTQLAETDGLTGLINIRTFKEKYASIKKENAWLYLIDIDDFKRINDEFGHLSGDRALKKLSEILSSAMRKNDFVCRMGGDEFLLLCNGIKSETAANKLAARLLSEVNTQAKNENFLSSISVGYTQIKEKESFEDAFERADYALYASKRNGKGKAICKKSS